MNGELEEAALQADYRLAIEVELADHCILMLTESERYRNSILLTRGAIILFHNPLTQHLALGTPRPNLELQPDQPLAHQVASGGWDSVSV